MNAADHLRRFPLIKLGHEVGDLEGMARNLYAARNLLPLGCPVHTWWNLFLGNESRLEQCTAPPFQSKVACVHGSHGVPSCPYRLFNSFAPPPVDRCYEVSVTRGGLILMGSECPECQDFEVGRRCPRCSNAWQLDYDGQYYRDYSQYAAPIPLSRSARRAFARAYDGEGYEEEYAEEDYEEDEYGEEEFNEREEEDFGEEEDNGYGEGEYGEKEEGEEEDGEEEYEEEGGKESLEEGSGQEEWNGRIRKAGGAHDAFQPEDRAEAKRAKKHDASTVKPALYPTRMIEHLQSAVVSLEQEGDQPKRVKALLKRIKELQSDGEESGGTPEAETQAAEALGSTAIAARDEAEPAVVMTPAASIPTAPAKSTPTKSGSATREKHERNAKKLHDQFGVCGFHCLHQHVRSGPNRPVCRLAAAGSSSCSNGSHNAPEGLLRWAFANLEQY